MRSWFLEIWTLEATMLGFLSIILPLKGSATLNLSVEKVNIVTTKNLSLKKWAYNSAS